jgi:hypothetical protein
MDRQVPDVDARAGMMSRKAHKEKNGDEDLVIARRIPLTYNDGRWEYDELTFVPEFMVSKVRSTLAIR